MEVELVVGEPSWIYRSMVDPVQVDRVYRGWHQLAKGTRAGFDNAIALFERVADTAPDLPTGSALAAFAYWYAATSGIAPDLEEALSSAGRHARAGIALDDPTGLSHMVAAALTLYDNGDLETALADARIALEHRPTCDVSYGVEASIERYRGNWEAAIAFAQRAIALSPTIKPWYETTLAGAYYSGERYQEAADTAEPVAAHTGGLEALLLLAGAQEALGLHRRAAATVREAMTRHPDARRSTLARSHPFRDEAALDRWMRHLEAAGMP
jgi:tetratricopeptide (TPR) repeat protein